MSGQPFRMGAFEQRVSDAVSKYLPMSSADLPSTVYVRDALVAGFKVMIDELAGKLEDAAPPVRELPTEPGAVVLARTVCGYDYDPPVALCTGNDPGRGLLAALDGRRFANGRQEVVGLDLGPDWQPATVVPTVAHDHVRAALRDIADESRFDPKEPVENVLADLRELAAEAVNVLDGEVTK